MKQETIENSDVPNPVDEGSLPTGKTKPIFQMIIIAFLRQKQLNNGANPRIEVPTLKTKNTRIAMEEVNQGLIFYNVLP